MVSLPRAVSLSSRILSGSLYGSGRRITACTTLKMAVFAPIPSACVTMVTAVNPGLFQSIRIANRKSCVSN